MSLKSWKAEFYPVDADECNEEDALEHSLLKWTGLLEENLNRHDVLKADGADFLVDGKKSFDIDSDSCALCLNYKCNLCPLYNVNYFVECSDDNEHGDNPYRSFISLSDPQPMINLINKAIKEESNVQPLRS